jgi:putative GTP pyrophosphokinase
MVDTLRSAYEGRIAELKVAAERLKAEALDALTDFPHLDRVTFRVKDVESFLAKARDPRNQPAYGTPLREIEDQIGGRIIVYFLNDIDKVIERLKRVFNLVERTVRRPEHDAEFGYESHHLICMIPPQARTPEWGAIGDAPATFELQVRTIFMHAYAQPQHRLAYKSNRTLGTDVRRRLAWIAASAWGSDRFYQDLFVELEAGIAPAVEVAGKTPSPS